MKKKWKVFGFLGAGLVFFLFGTMLLLPVFQRKPRGVVEESGLQRVFPVLPLRDSETLDVDDWDETYNAWTETGADPYLDAQDQPTNIISISSTDTPEEGWFDFEDTTLTGTIYVNLSIYCKNDDGSGNDYADVFVDYTGSGSGSDVADIGQHTDWQYDTIDLGGHTVSEVNNLRVYFEYQKVTSADDVYIDHAYLSVEGAAAAAESWQSVNNWNVTLSNASDWMSQEDWNLTLSNTSNWLSVQTWNLTLSNLTFSWKQISDWNITLSNTSQHNSVEIWNLTLSNSSSWNSIDVWNVTLSNTSNWVSVQIWNLTLSNTSDDTWQSINDWNLTLSNSSKYNSIEEWNLTLSNTSIDEWLSVQTWNLTLSNISSWNSIDVWNLTLSNTSIGNSDPVLSGESPSNNSVNVDVGPDLYVVVSDSDGDTINATWWTNASGVWLEFASNSSVASGVNISQFYPNFLGSETVYWWNVSVEDGEGGWCNETYSFTTERSTGGSGSYIVRSQVSVGFVLLFGLLVCIILIFVFKKREDEL